MVGASIGGQLCLSGATLINEAGPALYADRLTIEDHAFLSWGFTAIGHSTDGAVWLLGATIGGQLILRGATLINEAGPALAANRITVENNTYLDEGFTATGHGDLGVVRMVGAVLKGDLSLRGADLPAADRENDEPTVVFTGTAVGATVRLSSETLTKETTSGRWDINDFTYRALTADSDQWLTFLRDGTRRYSPQPYQQFAAVARTQGDERLTQKILIAQHDDLLTRSCSQHALLTRMQRAGLQVLRATVGYGYKTWRALVWLGLLVAVAVAATLSIGAGNMITLHHPADPQTGDLEGPCSTVELVVLGLDTIPLIPLVSGATEQCAVTDTPQGLAFLLGSIVLKILAWALVTLFAAGYTNIVRKPGP